MEGSEELSPPVRVVIVDWCRLDTLSQTQTREFLGPREQVWKQLIKQHQRQRPEDVARSHSKFNIRPEYPFPLKLKKSWGAPLPPYTNSTIFGEGTERRVIGETGPLRPNENFFFNPIRIVSFFRLDCLNYIRDLDGGRRKSVKGLISGHGLRLLQCIPFSFT